MARLLAAQTGRHARRTASRGFTLMEMLAVVAFIGILAAAAAPSFLRLMRDRRVQSLAIQQADMLRAARARAMGRGAAQLVRWDALQAVPANPGDPGRLQLREAVFGGTGGDQLLPASSCFAADWTNGSATSKAVASLEDRRSLYEWASVEMRKADGTVGTYVEICFTPRGRTYVRHDAAGAFLPLTGVYRFQVTNTETGLVRQVIIPPNGAARVESRL